MNDINELQILNKNSLYDYINRVNKIPILTDEQELNYAKEKDNGNVEAAKILVSSYLKLVVKIANSFRSYGLPMTDLISEGNIGLIRAVKTFDWTKGYKLATYSMWWIKAYIQEFILKTWSIVKIGTSASQKKLFFNLKKIKSQILGYSNKKILNKNDIRHISNTLGVSEQDVIDMNSILTKGDLYLNNRVSNEEDESSEVIDFIPSQQALQDVIVDNKRENEKKQKLFKEALNLLNEREREIINLRKLTDSPLTLSEISKKYNISGERARQIEARAIEKMTNYIKQKYNNIGLVS